MDDLMDLELNELKELHRLLRGNVSTLEDDIRQSKKKLKVFGFDAELSQELNVIQRSGGSTNVEEIIERLHDDIELLQRRIDETAKLTGISIAQVEENIELTDEESRTRVNLSLQVLGRSFNLICDIQNALPNAQQEAGGGVVSRVEVQIERDMSEVLEGALEKSLEDVAVHSTVCIIKSYLQCISDRDQLIEHFTEAYPDSITHWIQLQTHRLKIDTYDSRHPTFIFEWGLKLERNSTYTNVVTLKVDASDELKALDSKGVLDSSSEMFAHMSTTLGLKKAIDNFIRMIVSDGKDLCSGDRDPESFIDNSV